MNGPLRIAVVAGEESGDVLAADLIGELKVISGRDVTLIGTGGEHLAALGQKSLIDPEDISIKGISAVLSSLPKLLGHIRKVGSEIVRAKPDALLIVDNPDFTHRVAKRVRAGLPDLPIIDLVCPQVWAWRQWRAKTMRSYIDHVLCLLPFEPQALASLDGPDATYVGHRLAGLESLRRSYGEHRDRPVGASRRSSSCRVHGAAMRACCCRAIGKAIEILAAIGARAETGSADRQPHRGCRPRPRRRLAPAGQSRHWRGGPSRGISSGRRRRRGVRHRDARTGARRTAVRLDLPHRPDRVVGPPVHPRLVDLAAQSGRRSSGDSGTARLRWPRLEHCARDREAARERAGAGGAEGGLCAKSAGGWRSAESPGRRGAQVLLDHIERKARRSSVGTLNEKHRRGDRDGVS